MNGPPWLGRVFDDRTKRAYDALALIIEHTPGWMNRWVAVRLSDGSCDGQLYDHKRGAVRHQLHPQQCAYFCLPPDGVDLPGVAAYLRWVEQLYQAGMDISDPETHVPRPMNPAVEPYIIRAVRRS